MILLETPYSGKLFVKMLLEYLSKTDKLKDMPDYVTTRLEPYVDSDEKRKEYVKTPEMQEIKNDLTGFIREWIESIRELPQVQHVYVDPSPYFGLSAYVHINFVPTRKHLSGFYDNNKNLYYDRKFRFTDHPEIDYAKHPAEDQVDIRDKTFNQVADEMYGKIINYINNKIRSQETEYLEKRRKKKLRYMNRREGKNESVRLSIKEPLNEKLESIGSGIYCTDYVGNIADLLLNKPKAYRILYDSYFDIWCIADANTWTHDAMAKEMFGSGYVEENASNQALTSFLYDANQWLNTYLRGYKLSDKEIYKSFGFKKLYLTGCMFIPYSDDYRKYEESSFYSCETRLTTGTLFTYDNYQLSSEGVLKDLYTALEQRNAFVDSLENIWRRNVEMFNGDAIDPFYEEAEEYGYDEDEINDFLQLHLADVYRM